VSARLLLDVETFAKQKTELSTSPKASRAEKSSLGGNNKIQFSSPARASRKKKSFARWKTRASDSFSKIKRPAVGKFLRKLSYKKIPHSYEISESFSRIVSFR
jgi:hypothetical protein